MTRPDAAPADIPPMIALSVEGGVSNLASAIALCGFRYPAGDHCSALPCMMR